MAKLNRHQCVHCPTPPVYLRPRSEAPDCPQCGAIMPIHNGGRPSDHMLANSGKLATRPDVWPTEALLGATIGAVQVEVTDDGQDLTLRLTANPEAMVHQIVAVLEDYLPGQGLGTAMVSLTGAQDHQLLIELSVPSLDVPAFLRVQVAQLQEGV